MRRALVATVCAVVLGLGVAPAHAAFDDPLFFYTPQPPSVPPIEPPPFGYLNGPCGLAVNASGRLYLSDYYHRSIDVFGFNPEPKFESQPLTAYTGALNAHTGPLDDPCGMALSSTGDLYLDDYHREVVRFPSPFNLATAETIDTGDASDPYANPTGVAVDPETDHVLVDDRAYVAEYDSTGSFVQRIGEGDLGDGYGIAVSGHASTAGYLYVPDAQSDTVKVYDPASSTTIPAQTILGPSGGFGSLADSAVAVDDSTGEVYVVDTLGPQLTEEPWAIVYVFSAAGSYEGRLKHTTIGATPVGLAVDNTGGSTQGRVYVTSGITENASFYSYPAHAATNAPAPPLVFSTSNASTGVAVANAANSPIAGVTAAAIQTSLPPMLPSATSPRACRRTASRHAKPDAPKRRSSCRRTSTPAHKRTGRKIARASRRLQGESSRSWRKTPPNRYTIWQVSK